MSERLQTRLAELKEEFEQGRSNLQDEEMIPMKEQLQARIAGLREAFRQGDLNFQNLEAQKNQQRDDLLRLDGAIRILEEIVQTLEEEERKQAVKPEQASASGA